MMFYIGIGSCKLFLANFLLIIVFDFFEFHVFDSVAKFSDSTDVNCKLGQNYSIP